MIFSLVLCINIVSVRHSSVLPLNDSGVDDDDGEGDGDGISSSNNNNNILLSIVSLHSFNAVAYELPHAR